MYTYNNINSVDNLYQVHVCINNVNPEYTRYESYHNDIGLDK